jgi:DNA polymerase III sliding clamp (beta) subunit (PCNA family)
MAKAQTAKPPTSGPGLELDRAEFLRTIDKVRPTVSNSKIIPLYQCFCFKENKVSSFSGTAGTMTTLKLNNWDFAVEADRFYKIIRSMPEALKLELKGEKLYIRSGRNETWLNVFPTHAFPQILPESGQAEDYYTGKDLVEGLKTVAFSICTNPMKPNLLGVAVSDRFLYSSDGNRISRFTLKDPVPRELTIPVSAVEHLIKLGPPDLVFTTGNNVGALWNETKTVYVTQTIAYSFPTKMVDAILSEMTDLIVELPEETINAVKRVSLLTPTDDNELIVAYDPKDHLLRLSTATNEVGSAREFIPWAPSPELPAFKASIKPWFVDEALEHTRKIDLSDIIDGSKRMLRFTAENYEHLAGLMQSRD